MHVDSSIELGRDDPALEFPWASDDGSIHYLELKSNPALIDDLPEAGNYWELRDFLLRINAPGFPFQTVKSDIWITHEILPEEEIFASPQKLISYVDLIFSAPAPRFSLDSHLQLVNKLCTALQHAPDMPASIEFIIRHCYYREVMRGGADQRELPSTIPDFGAEKFAALNNSSESNSSSCAAYRPLKPCEKDLGFSQQDPEHSEQDLERREEDLEAPEQDLEASEEDPEASEQDLGLSEQDLGLSEQKLDLFEQEAELSEQEGELSEQEGELSEQEGELSEQDKVADSAAASLMSQDAEPDLRCGFSITVYVSGFGGDEQQARQRWSIALKLLQHALVQVVARSEE